jgi:hypothetical protein
MIPIEADYMHDPKFRGQHLSVAQIQTIWNVPDVQRANATLALRRRSLNGP